MGGARHGKGKSVYQASFGVYEGCSVPYVKFWFHALWLWCESKGRRFLQALAFAACFFAAGLAYAVPGYQSGLAGVIQGPSAWYEYGASVDDPYYGYFCYAYDKYEAAVWSLGLDPTSSSFTAEAKAKLSNASTGGRFYTYADNFHTFGANSEPHAWLSRDFYGQWVTLYGRDFLYWGEVTTAEQDGAKADLQTILNGGSLGGGGSSGGHDGDYYVGEQLSLTGINSKQGDNTKTFNIDKSHIANYMNDNSGEYSYVVLVEFTNNTSVAAIWSFKTSEVIFELVDTNGGKAARFSNVTNHAIYIYNYALTDGSFVNGSFTGYNYFFGQEQIWRHTVSGSNGIYTENVCNYYWYSGDDNTPSVPGTNWPESDPVEPPQPPDVPEPQEPEIDPQPDAPTPQPSPTFPIYVDVSTTTYTADLQGILDALNDHCIHLQNALHTNFSDFWTSLSTKMTNDFATLRQYLHGQFSWLGETVQDEFSETRDYLKELFEWLADQIDYSISGGAYDDNTVVSWLKKIYSKLGTGTSSKPVDPVADPDQTGSWLDTLINNLLTALEDLFPGLIGQVADFFGGTLGNLTQKFPFSIPWDIAAILGMLVAEPVAPSVEIPAYTLTVEGLTQAGSYDIDLSAYDAAWGAVRIMMRIAFALYVCVHTKDFLEVIERVMM